jgi:hypothetical protein
MTDKELLELAAKAAGIKLKPMEIKNVTKQGDDRFIGYMTDCEQWARGWFNSLNSNDDALRLAVLLQLQILPPETEFGLDRASVRIPGVRDLVDAFDDDPCAATRRAITLAAAKIGAEK